MTMGSIVVLERGVGFDRTVRTLVLGAHYHSFGDLLVRFEARCFRKWIETRMPVLLLFFILYVYLVCFFFSFSHLVDVSPACLVLGRLLRDNTRAAAASLR
jgi:hypothetical protein